jgi:hypothetical protein
VHLVVAESWRDAPYTYNGTGTIFPGFDNHGIEDPFLYVQPWPTHLKRYKQDGGQEDGEEQEEQNPYTYHAIFHDHSTFGGHAFSRDGVSWTYSSTVPFANEVSAEGGEY